MASEAAAPAPAPTSLPLSFLPQNTPPSPAGSSEGATPPSERTWPSPGLGSEGACLEDAAFPVSAYADCFGFSFYVDIYYKWPCVRHTLSYTRMCTLSSPPGHTLTSGLSGWGASE